MEYVFVLCEVLLTITTPRFFCNLRGSNFGLVILIVLVRWSWSWSFSTCSRVQHLRPLHGRGQACSLVQQFNVVLAVVTSDARLSLFWWVLVLDVVDYFVIFILLIYDARLLCWWQQSDVMLGTCLCKILVLLTPVLSSRSHCHFRAPHL